MKTVGDVIEPFVVTGINPGSDKFFDITEKSFEGNETKNEINASRNNPFSVYEKSGNDPGTWTSPWGKSDEFMKLAYTFNMKTNSTIAAFSLPFLHNVGLKVENAVKLARLADQNKSGAVFGALRKNYESRIHTYKQKIIERFCPQLFLLLYKNP